MYASPQADRLTREIRDVLLAAGVSEDAPVTEQELADRFGVSRTPVRDALRVLEEEGLVERRRKKGVYLRTPSIQEIAEVYELRAVLEGFAGRLAVENAGKDDVKQLSLHAREFTRSRKKGNRRKAEEANIAFHNKIVELAGNNLLATMMHRFRIVRRAFELTHSLPDDPTDEITPYPHEAIVERIAERDADGCERLLQAHIRRTKHKLVERALGLRLDRGL